MRRYGHFDLAEDAVQEALLAAATQWPAQGTPSSPKGWLITVAGRRMTDFLRSDSARRRREESAAALMPSDSHTAPSAADASTAGDDSLTLLFLCCHPAVSPASQVALTLRAVGGLTTAQIAGAFLVPEATMAQRISRAKKHIKASGGSFAMPPDDDRAERLRAVLHVLYLIFNEGYTATSGPHLRRGDLTREAIRLTRGLRQILPADGEVAGLLALMLLIDARRAARTTSDGELIPLDEQDRSRWDAAEITEGVGLVTDALAHATLGPYQVQAAIAAVHAEARSPADTDWPQVLALYGVLDTITSNPMIALNRAVADAMVHGPQAGLKRLADLDADERLAGHHRLAAVRAHLLERTGDVDAAREAYLLAARRTRSLPEKRYLEARAARLHR